MSEESDKLIVRQFEAGRITWGEDERYRNIAAYHEACRRIGEERMRVRRERPQEEIEAEFDARVTGADT